MVGAHSSVSDEGTAGVANAAGIAAAAATIGVGVGAGPAARLFLFDRQRRGAPREQDAHFSFSKVGERKGLAHREQLRHISRWKLPLPQL